MNTALLLGKVISLGAYWIFFIITGRKFTILHQVFQVHVKNPCQGR